VDIEGRRPISVAATRNWRTSAFIEVERVLNLVCQRFHYTMDWLWLRHTKKMKEMIQSGWGKRRLSPNIYIKTRRLTAMGGRRYTETNQADGDLRPGALLIRRRNPWQDAEVQYASA
jgi:hypothetical protein